MSGQQVKQFSFSNTVKIQIHLHEFHIYAVQDREKMLLIETHNNSTSYDKNALSHFAFPHSIIRQRAMLQDSAPWDSIGLETGTNSYTGKKVCFWILHIKK